MYRREPNVCRRTQAWFTWKSKEHAAWISENFTVKLVKNLLKINPQAALFYAIQVITTCDLNFLSQEKNEWAQLGKSNKFHPCFLVKVVELFQTQGYRTCQDETGYQNFKRCYHFSPLRDNFPIASLVFSSSWTSTSLDNFLSMLKVKSLFV